MTARQNVQIYIGEQAAEYAGVIIHPGAFVDFGARKVPQDGLWRAADADEVRAHLEAIDLNKALGE